MIVIYHYCYRHHYCHHRHKIEGMHPSSITANGQRLGLLRSTGAEIPTPGAGASPCLDLSSEYE